MNSDFIGHFLLRLIAWGILEPRIRRGAFLSPETLADLQQPLKLLRDTCAQAQVFFEELNLCRTCPAGCCGGDFSRFTVYDHIFHVAAGIAHPPGWGYRLFPVPRLRRHPSGKGMCGLFQDGKGCVLPYEIRPGLCVWWTCSRMNERLGKAEKARVMAIRHGFDAAYREAAKILLRNGLRLPSDAGYGMRTRNVLADTYRLVMRQGISAGWAFLRPRLARNSETILYEYRPSAGEQAGPIPGLTIVRVTRAGRSAYETDLVRAGAGFDLRFSGGAQLRIWRIKMERPRAWAGVSPTAIIFVDCGIRRQRSTLQAAMSYLHIGAEASIRLFSASWRRRRLRMAARSWLKPRPTMSLLKPVCAKRDLCRLAG